MIEFVLSLPTWLGLGFAMILTLVMGLVVYIVSYKLISKNQNFDLKEPTSNLFHVVGLLVSLMLSLGFSKVLGEVNGIHIAIEREAVAISDIFHYLVLFDKKETRKIQTIIVDYTQAVIDDDWPALANDKLGQRATTLKKQLNEAVMNLEPTTSNQEKLWSLIAADLDALSDNRFIRLDYALQKPPVFVYVIIFGFLITMACFGVYRPQTPLVVLVSLYTSFVGLVLYLILQLSDPFQGGIGVDTTTLEHLLETMRSEI